MSKICISKGYNIRQNRLKNIFLTKRLPNILSIVRVCILSSGENLTTDAVIWQAPKSTNMTVQGPMCWWSAGAPSLVSVEVLPVVSSAAATVLVGGWRGKLVSVLASFSSSRCLPFPVKEASDSVLLIGAVVAMALSICFFVVFLCSVVLRSSCCRACSAGEKKLRTTRDDSWQLRTGSLLCWERVDQHYRSSMIWSSHSHWGLR